MSDPRPTTAETTIPNCPCCGIITACCDVTGTGTAGLPLPRTLHATVTAAVPACACLAGLTAELVWDAAESGWVSGEIPAALSTGTGTGLSCLNTEYIRIKFHCVAGVWTASVGMPIPIIGFLWCGGGTPASAAFSCDPLSVSWGGGSGNPSVTTAGSPACTVCAGGADVTFDMTVTE